MPEALTILALSDSHFASHPSATASHLDLPVDLGFEWLGRALEEALRRCRPDVIILLGDLIDDGASPEAEQDLAKIAGAIRDTGIPLVVAPGNHDGDSTRMLRVFGDHAGAHLIKGYCLYSFADPFAEDQSMERPAAEIERFLAADLPQPLIVLQHNPIFPDVPPTDFPFMPKNAQAIRDSYRRKKVLLSISGHYHSGQEMTEQDGTTYVTTAALSHSPFRFDLIRVNNGRVSVERIQLRVPEHARVIDCHTHTHFGYCAVDVHPEGALKRAVLLGARRVACVEHAGQVYLTPEEFWAKRHIDDPTCLRRARTAGTDRIAAFRNAMSAVRSEQLLIGLEVEMDRDGKLTLLDEDKEGWDVLLGAIHWLPEGIPHDLERFLEATERIAGLGITILAHPFRYAYQKKFTVDEAACRRVVAALKKHGVAAEVNFHYNAPAPEFYRLCREEGVPVIFGSDAHLLKEVCDFHQHVRLMESVGIPLDKLAAPAQRD